MDEAIRGEVNSIRVLHVDDEPDLTDLAATFLEREYERFEVETATTASAALNCLSDTDFDCIVSDYEMPGQNGIELLETIREDYSELPFILYTGKGSEEVASEAISAGVTDYLQKGSATSQYTVLANRIANAVDQYHSQRRLEESQMRLSLFVEQSPLGVIEWNENFEVKMVNEVAEEILGYDQAELRGRSWESIVPESDRETVDEVVSELLAADGGHHSINENVRKDGDRIICEWHNRIVTDDENQVVAIFSQFQDITERREHKQQLETTLDNHPGYIYRHEYKQGWPLEYVKGNPESVTGYTATELEEIHTAEDIIHPDDKEDVWDEVETELKANEKYDLTYRIVTKDDEIRWIRDIGQIVEDPVTGEPKLDGFIVDFSDRKERERELEETNAVISTLFETLPVGILAEDASRNVLAINERMFELFDIPGSTDELHGADCRDIAERASGLFADPAEFVERTNKLVTEHTPMANEELTLSDGRTFERSYRSIELPDGDGHLWMYRDITERTDRQQALESVLDEMDDAIFVHPGDGTFTFVNQAAVERYGYTEDELLGMAPDDINAHDPSDVSARVRDVKETGQSVFETEHQTQSGETIPVEINATTVTFQGEESILSIARDITERKRTERELRKTKERLDLAVEGTRLGVWDWDMQTDEVEYNAHWAEMLGYSLADIDPHLDAWETRVHPDDKEAVQSALDAHLAGESDYYDTEHRMETAHGNWKWIRDIGKVVERTPDGDPSRAVGIHIDISEQKERERELRRQNERLNRFINVISHDLRNPLQVASGRIELAQDEFESPSLDKAADAIERSLALIEDLLTLAREAEPADEFESVDLESMTKQCWKTVLTGEASLVVETEQTINGNPGRLKQVFENLFRNAVEHGGEDVRVTVGKLDRGFYVADDGSGIPEENRADIFEPGYSTGADGTGFGLSIVNEIVAAHGWEIRVTDSAAGGARFEITGVEKHET